VIALGLVAALVLEAFRSRRPLHRNELAGAALVMAGVVAVVGTGRPGHNGDPARGWVVPTCAAVVAVTVLAVRRSRHRVGGVAQARVLGAAAGACFAVDAVFLQRLATTVDGGLATGLAGLLAVLAGDPVTLAVDGVGFLGAGLVGGVAVHRAYQVAPLRSVQPAMAAAEPVTAFLIGAVVLDEGVRGGGWGHAVLVAGLVALTAGILVGLTAPSAEGAPQVGELPAAPLRTRRLLRRGPLPGAAVDLRPKHPRTHDESSSSPARAPWRPTSTPPRGDHPTLSALGRPA
jgi:drug/metabolite transporter (DMT)-like permease